MNIPFKRFVVAMLLYGHDYAYVLQKLKAFGYFAADEDIDNIYKDMISQMPESLSEKLSKKIKFDMDNDLDSQWAKQLGVFEFCDYIQNKKKDSERKNYFKWFDDCLWIHDHSEAVVLVNIFMFNGEPIESIADILSFRYRKKITADALRKYVEIFWDFEKLSGPDVLHFCRTMRNSSLVIRKMRSGQSIAMACNDESDNGCDVDITMHDNEYLKWKIGYHDIKIPTANDVMSMVQRDSYFKMKEAMSMLHSIESEEEQSDSDQFGSTTITRKRKRNVEEVRVKAVKQWFDIYIKASEKVTDKNVDKDFFERMDQLELEFGDFEGDKIISVDDFKDIADDISGDMR